MTTIADGNSSARTATVHRLLLVSYHFPPSEAAGALRWQRLTPIASHFGWEVDAITLAPDLADRVGWERVGDLPPHTQIHSVDSPEPLIGRLEIAAWRAWRALRRPAAYPAPRSRPTTFHRSEVRWLSGGPRAFRRAWNVVLDYARESAWARAAVVAGLQVSERHRHDLVISCGPPHLGPVAGRGPPPGLPTPLPPGPRAWSTWRAVASLEPSRLHSSWTCATRGVSRRGSTKRWPAPCGSTLPTGRRPDAWHKRTSSS